MFFFAKQGLRHIFLSSICSDIGANWSTQRGPVVSSLLNPFQIDIEKTKKNKWSVARDKPLH